MTQSSVLERFRKTGAELVPAAMFPWSRPAAPGLTPGCIRPLVQIPTTVPRCGGDEAGGDTELEVMNAAIHGKRDWISDLLEIKRDAAPGVVRPVRVKYNSVSIVRH